LTEYVDLLSSKIEVIIEHFNGMWIRSSDIRTDEFASLQAAPRKEMNPMLGLHGIRFSLKHPKIFEAELMAIRKVALKHPNKIFGVMFPQVILLEEVKQAKEHFLKFKTPNMRFGTMIETPAACMIIEDICKEGVDFISFGTNDLTQFTLAIDREEEDVQFLYNELNPAIYALIKRVIGVCRRYKVETSICGQAGSKKEMVEFLFRKGINSVSVNADAAYDISVLINQLQEEWNNKKETGTNEE
jgi:pyruvate,water dikinase